MIFNTHKIKSKKEYGFSKQKNNRIDVYISFFCFKNPHPFRKPPYSKSTPIPSKTFRLYYDDWLMKSKQKIKKKESKGKFQVYKKASSSLRFLIKSPPITVRNNILFRLHALTPDDISGSILSKKLAFLKPST